MVKILPKKSCNNTRGLSKSTKTEQNTTRLFFVGQKTETERQKFPCYYKLEKNPETSSWSKLFVFNFFLFLKSGDQKVLGLRNVKKWSNDIFVFYKFKKISGNGMLSQIIFIFLNPVNIDHNEWYIT